MIFLESSLFLHFFFFSFFTQTILAGTSEVPETNKQNFNKKHAKIKWSAQGKTNKGKSIFIQPQTFVTLLFNLLYHLLPGHSLY